MKLTVNRGDSVGMVAKGEEMVAKGCPLNGFAQAFLKLDVVQVHTLFLFLQKRKPVLKEKREDEMRGENALCGFDQTFLKFDAWFESMWGDGERKRKEKERNPKKSAEEGRYDINTRFFAVGKSKKEPFFSKGFFCRKKSFRR